MGLRHSGPGSPSGDVEEEDEDPDLESEEPQDLGECVEQCPREPIGDPIHVSRNEAGIGAPSDGGTIGIDHVGVRGSAGRGANSSTGAPKCVTVKGGESHHRSSCGVK